MIETRARRAAGAMSHASVRQRQWPDRKSRSIDRYHQSIVVQLQKRRSLPFAYRHRRLLLPQSKFSEGSGDRAMACAFASPNGTAPETYANAGIRREPGGLPTGLSIRMRFFDPGAWWGLCMAAKESLATMRRGQDRRRNVPDKVGCDGGWR